MQKNKFLSVPYGLVSIIVSLTGTVSLTFLLIYSMHSDQASPIYTFILSVLIFFYAILFPLFFFPSTLCLVEIKSDRIICHIPFHKNVEIEYEKCYIGFDYHNQNGGKIWWIYFSYGKMPPYKNPQLGNRINSIKCQPGFVRIMYRDEVYNALLETLPPKQKTALEAARRHSGFEKQRKIYM